MPRPAPLVTILVFGKVLIGLNFNQLRREADFRYSLVRVRENAESIAFYRGEVQELQQVSRRFTAAFNNFKQLIRRQLGLNFFQHAYNLLTIVVLSAIIAPRVLSGELEVGAVVQAAGAFAAVLSAISLIVENFRRAQSLFGRYRSPQHAFPGSARQLGDCRYGRWHDQPGRGRSAMP